MIVVPFIVKHYEDFIVSQHQEECKDSLSIGYLEELSQISEAYSIIDNDKVICIAGLTKVNEFRVQVWAIMSSLTKGKMFGVTRHVNQFLNSKKYDRIEVTIKTDFLLGHKWALALGFERECTMEKYAYGQSFDLYRRLN